LCIKNSINALTTRSGIGYYNKIQLIETIISDYVLTCKEINDDQCKCFTGRMSRVVNCLNGFSPLVNINIKDSDQIGNIIMLIKSQLINNYNVEIHKQTVKQKVLIIM
jgi:hypothetical protein